MQGWFDQDAVPQGWFAAETQPLGWFNRMRLAIATASITFPALLTMVAGRIKVKGSGDPYLTWTGARYALSASSVGAVSLRADGRRIFSLTGTGLDIRDYWLGVELFDLSDSFDTRDPWLFG